MKAEAAARRFGDFSIRPWQADDCDAVVAVLGQVLNEYGLNFEPEEADRDVVEVSQHYSDRGGEFWVIELDGRLVGTAAFFPLHDRPEVAEIRKMYLLPEARGKGLGRWLLKLLEDRARERGFRYARLETAAVLKEAIALYESAGYTTASDAVATRRCDRVLIKPL
ncbi:GNAT family N-acetyltransferase [Natronospira bacteriovora]|uniref:GNAT family N-acetyltransferase n=1 Tax=Natronospira bacteriovora TaxID=3069753 RepID=A0ABU0W4R1_9GAMM|nr:GNAT family N-acetyltransferase [Natronospira sp. AB-CW4]MDQ2068957.1 GNAT family N-acetyltransferase [Natronospira sp. AB-CW4]